MRSRSELKYSILLVFSITIGVLSIISLQIHSVNAETISPLLTFGSPGSGQGQFILPRGIAVDSSGNIYVSDRDGTRVEKFDPSGHFLSSINGLANPEGIAFDNSGNIYITEVGKQRVDKFNSTGTFLSSFGTPGFVGPGGVSDPSWLNDPERIAIDSSGNIFVTGGSGPITKFDPSGKFLPSFSSYDSHHGFFEGPSCIVQDNLGNLLVNSGMDTIDKFNSNGTLEFSFGNQGKGNGQFFNLKCIAVDSSGNIYAVDQANHRVQKFDQSGNFLLSFGSELSCWVTSSDYDCAKVLSSSNSTGLKQNCLQWENYECSISLPLGQKGTANGLFTSASGIAIDSLGNIYVADEEQNRVQKFDSSGKFLLSFGSAGSNNGQFKQPEGIAIDKDDKIYVADSFNNRIEIFDSKGNFMSSFDSIAINTGNHHFSYPWAITFDSSGNIYVADSGNSRVEKFNSKGAYLSETGWGSPQCMQSCRENGELINAQGVTVDNLGNIYVLDQTQARVQKFDPAGNYLLSFGSPKPFLYPEGITIDGSDNIYVADSSNIVKFNSTGARVSSFGSSVLYSTIPGSPSDVALDSLGRIYVTDTNHGRIVVFNSTGSVISSFGIQDTPIGIAIDKKSDRIYVTGIHTDRVFVFSTSQLSNTTSTFVPQKQAIQLNDNLTALSLAVRLATNSPQFQSLVTGYNYCFSSDFNENGPVPQGGIGLTRYGLAFELYKGPIKPGAAVKVVEVFVDPALTRVLDVTINGASYMGSSLSASSQVTASSIVVGTSASSQTDTLSEIKKWSGLSPVSSISDAVLLNDMNMHGTHIPSWLKKVAEWAVDGKISQDDFVNAIKYVDENGITK
jgi:sugar lactone lactonase YvrE